MRILFTATLYRIEESLLDFCGDWTTYAFANLTIIIFTDWCHFCGSPSKERFIRNIEFITGNTAFNHFITQIFRNGNNRLTGNTIQRATSDLGLASRQMGRTMANIDANPQSLIYGAGVVRPGPGEPGFVAP